MAPARGRLLKNARKSSSSSSSSAGRGAEATQWARRRAPGVPPTPWSLNRRRDAANGRFVVRALGSMAPLSLPTRGSGRRSSSESPVISQVQDVAQVRDLLVANTMADVAQCGFLHAFEKFTNTASVDILRMQICAHYTVLSMILKMPS